VEGIIILSLTLHTLSIAPNDLMDRQLIQTPLKELQTEAFRIRKAHFSNELTFSIPGTVSYHDDTLPFKKNRFAVISVTGSIVIFDAGTVKGNFLNR